MIILHVLNMSKYSGAENVACQIIEHFSSNDEIKCYYCSPSGEVDDILKNKGINHITISKLSYGQLKKIIKLVHPDIIHAHDFRASLIASLICGIPVISHIHQNAPWLKHFGLNSIVYLLFSIRYKKILVVSDCIEKEYVFGRFIHNKTVNIGNPFDISKFDVIHKNNTIKDYHIGWCGRLSEEKDPLLFLDIMHTIIQSGINLKIAMIGDGPLKDSICKKSELLGIKNNIEMFGFIENPYPVMNKCRVFVIPSVYEGFGLVALESLSLGIPVVCSGNGGLDRLIDDSCGRKCKSICEYVEEIKRLLFDNDYYDQKVHNALNKAYSFNNYADYMNTIGEIYAKCYHFDNDL